jgi:hypothetical protein
MVLAFCCCRASVQGWAVKQWLLVPVFSARERNLCCCAWYQVDASIMDINVNYIRFLGAFAKLRKAAISFVMSVSVCPSAWNNSAPTGRIFMKFEISRFFENLSRKLKFHYNLTRIKGTLHERLCIFIIIFGSFLHRKRLFQTRVVENKKTHILCSVIFFFKSCRL